MKFIINTSNMQSGGALQVSLSLLQQWRSRGDHEFHVLLSPQLALLIRETEFPAHFRFYPIGYNPGRSLWLALWHGRKMNRLVRGIGADAVLTVFGPALWKPRLPHIVGFANGYYLFKDSSYIQDLLRQRPFYQVYYRFRRRLLLYFLEQEARAWWVETETARQGLLQAWHKPEAPVSVIGNTYGSAFEQPAPVAPSASCFSLLCLSAYYPHKNLALLPQVQALLQAAGMECRFVVTLPEEQFAQLYGPAPSGIVNAGPQAPEALPLLYAAADAVFLPTLLEICTAVYPEAMKAGRPLLTSDRPFARELCGDAALYFDPLSAADAASCILKLAADPALRQQLVDKGRHQLHTFETPASRAARLLDLMERLPGQQQL